MSRLELSNKKTYEAGMELTRDKTDEQVLCDTIAELENDNMRLKKEHIQLARLSADTPQFGNPIHVTGAKAVRDRILEAIK